MWFWAEETQLNINELRYELLLSIDSTGHNAWHRAADKGSLSHWILYGFELRERN